MDTIPSTTPNISPFISPRPANRQKILIASILLVVIVLVVGLVVKDKLKLDLSKKNETNTTPSTTKTLESSSSAIKSSLLTFSCPTTAALCQKDEFFKGDALEIKTQEKLPVLAVFEGSVESFTASSSPANPDDKFHLILLTNKDLGLQAAYYFKGEPDPDQKTAKKGGTLGQTSGEPLINRNNSSFVLEINRLDAKDTQSMELQSKNFK